MDNSQLLMERLMLTEVNDGGDRVAADRAGRMPRGFGGAAAAPAAPARLLRAFAICWSFGFAAGWLIGAAIWRLP